MRFTYHETSKNIKITIMDFTTNTNDDTNIDFYLDGEKEFLKKHFDFEPFEYDTITETAIVDWHFYMESRSWGVKSIGVYATKISGLTLWVDFYNDERSEYADGREFDLTKLIKDFEVESESEPNDQYCVTEIDIDFNNEKIIVKF